MYKAFMYIFHFIFPLSDILIKLRKGRGEEEVGVHTARRRRRRKVLILLFCMTGWTVFIVTGYWIRVDMLI
jgi:hypothetical protein